MRNITILISYSIFENWRPNVILQIPHNMMLGIPTHFEIGEYHEIERKRTCYFIRFGLNE